MWLSLPLLLHGGEPAQAPRILAWHYPHYMPRQDMRPSSALRRGDWKIIHWHESHILELFHLADDPSEAVDLAAAQPERALELYALLEQWRRHAGALMPRPNPAFSP